jgi:hypothetical protein
MLEVTAVGVAVGAPVAALVIAAFTLYRELREKKRRAEVRTVDRWIQAEQELQLFPRE